MAIKENLCKRFTRQNRPPAVQEIICVSCSPACTKKQNISLMAYKLFSYLGEALPIFALSPANLNLSTSFLVKINDIKIKPRLHQKSITISQAKININLRFSRLQEDTRRLWGNQTHSASTVLSPTAQIFNRTAFEVKYLNVASFILYLHNVKATTESVTDFFPCFSFSAFPPLNFKNITETKKTCTFSNTDLTDPRNCTNTVEFNITQQF